MAKKPYIIKDIQLKISLRLKELRLKEGYTSYENFALDKGIDRKQYWRAENGANLTVNSLIKLLNLHKITLEEFFKEF